MLFPFLGKGRAKNTFDTQGMKIAKRRLVQILPTYLPTGRVLLTYMEGFSRNRGVYYHVPGGFAVGAEPVRRPGEAPGGGVFEERVGVGA